MNARVWWISVVLAACGTNSPSGTGVIGPNGGQVTVGDSASVSIPAGALQSNTTITATASDATAPTDTVAVGTPYIFGPEGTQFQVPVTVTLAFTSNLIPAGTGASDIVIYTAPAGSTSYQALTTSVVDASHVSAPVMHFSIFVPAVATGGEQVDAGVSVDAAIDAATATCTPLFTGGVQACTFTATCNGHMYKAQCSSSACTCTIDNGSAHQVGNVGGTCSGTTGQPGWGACMFP